MADAPLPRRFVERLRAFATPGPRMVDEAECVISVLLAILFAHLIGAANVAWAAFSGYMVMRGHVADTLSRGVRRIVGTVIGAGLALLLLPPLAGSPVAQAIVLAAIGGATLHGAIVGRHAYAWLFLGLTFAMIALDAIAQPNLALTRFAATRIAEVAAGTAACVLVSLVSTLTVRRRIPGARAVADAVPRLHPHSLRHAAQGAVALGLLPLLHAWHPLPELEQSGITIFAAMIVPVSGLGGGGLHPVSRRLAFRVGGCVAGAVLAAAILFVAHGVPALLVLGTGLGVAIGRHVENGPHRLGYVGTQFTLALLIILVPDSYAALSLEPALARLAGIAVGIAVLEPILLAWHAVAPMRAVPAPPPPVATAERGE